MKLLRRCALMVAVCACLVQQLESLVTCTTAELVVPLFGQLILLPLQGGEEDITRVENRLISYPDGTRIEYRCADGYQPYDTVRNVTLSGLDAAAICLNTMQWSLLNVECTAYDCGSPPSVENGTSSFNTTFIGSTATYTCDTGYSLSPSDPNYNDTGKAVCDSAGVWIHVPTCTANRVIGNFEIVVIVASALGGVAILFLFCTIFFCLWVILLKHRYSMSGMEEAEVTLARAQKIYTLDNPLSEVKEEDSSVGKPLYLTPEEMSTLHHNSKH